MCRLTWFGDAKKDGSVCPNEERRARSQRVRLKLAFAVALGRATRVRHRCEWFRAEKLVEVINRSFILFE